MDGPQPPIDNPGWRVGVSHDLNARVKLHTSANQRSRFPSLRELYSGALNRFQPNPDLKPETLLGFEGGVTVNRVFASTAKSTLQVIGFRHRLDDAVVRITLSNPTRFMRVNRDRIESSGVEVLGGLVFGTDANRSVSLNGDATLQRISIFDKTANDLQRHSENNPETRGRLELGVPLPAQLRAFATVRYSGSSFASMPTRSARMNCGGARCRTWRCNAISPSRIAACSSCCGPCSRSTTSGTSRSTINADCHSRDGRCASPCRFDRPESASSDFGPCRFLPCPVAASCGAQSGRPLVGSMRIDPGSASSRG